jgi:hypothetical protein
MPPRPGAWNPFAAADQDGHEAAVFWRADACAAVLPLLALAWTNGTGGPRLSRAGLRCRISVLLTPNGRQLVLFSQDGRVLQLEVSGAPVFEDTRLLADVLVPSERTRARQQALARLADLVCHGVLRPRLYPCHPRRKRLALVLQALDGDLDGAPPRDIAIALYGADRVQRDWSDAGENLRDQIRRAVKRGRFLMEGGYRMLLR